MNVDFRATETKFEKILDELEGELGKYQEKKLIKINSDRMCDRFWMEKLTTKITT